MATIGRKKAMVKLIIDNGRFMAKELGNEARKRVKEEKVTPEEHEERLKKLKEAGLLK